MMPVLIEVGSHFFAHCTNWTEIVFDLEYLKGALDEFVKELPVPVRILRNNNRLGLMKSRLKGREIRERQEWRSMFVFEWKVLK